MSLLLLVVGNKGVYQTLIAKNMKDVIKNIASYLNSSLKDSNFFSEIFINKIGIGNEKKNYIRIKNPNAEWHLRNLED